MAKYKVFACEVLFREVCAEAAVTQNVIDLTFVRYGLHHVGCEKMVAELQSHVDAVEPGKYEAILLIYGLCNNGIVGLKSRSTPLVLPKAHDCITLLLGSKERYNTEFGREPGTYYLSPGWLEHLNVDEQESLYCNLGLNMPYEKMVELYGEENAKYLLETMGSLGTHKETYTRIAYIDTGFGPKEDLIAQSRARAEQNGWRLDLLQGDRALIRKMLDGEWSPDDFVVVRSEQAVKPTYDGAVIKAE